jgi:hypothetical protein
LRADRPPSRPPLPAPYRSPWLQLGHDLAALAAWLRLKLRELWRRNREGSLWRPPFWPEAAAALFWPLLLLLLLVLPLVPLLAGRTSSTPSGHAASAGQMEAAGEARPPSWSEGSGAADEPVVPDAPVVPDEPPPPQAPPASEVPLPPAGTQPPADPLLAALAQGEEPPLIAAVRSYPARALLVLKLGDDYTALAAPQRQERAERWLARGRDLGFEAVELRDRGGALLGRSALVGSGMILLDPDLA